MISVDFQKKILHPQIVQAPNSNNKSWQTHFTIVLHTGKEHAPPAKKLSNFPR